MAETNNPRGAGRKYSGGTKRISTTLSMTPEQAELIKKKAGEQGMNVSQYILSKCLDDTETIKNPNLRKSIKSFINAIKDLD